MNARIKLRTLGSSSSSSLDKIRAHGHDRQKENLAHVIAAERARIPTPIRYILNAANARIAREANEHLPINSSRYNLTPSCTLPPVTVSNIISGGRRHDSGVRRRAVLINTERCDTLKRERERAREGEIESGRYIRTNEQILRFRYRKREREKCVVVARGACRCARGKYKVRERRKRGAVAVSDDVYSMRR